MQTSINLFGDGFNYTCHPIPDNWETKDWFSKIKSEYESDKTKIVECYSSYYNPGFDALTCPAEWLYRKDLQPKGEWGVEVKWQNVQ